MGDAFSQFSQRHMGYEYKLETYDAERANLPEFARAQPSFLFEEAKTFHFGPSQDRVLFSMSQELELGHVYLCLHVASPDTNTLMALIIRRLLACNDHVVVSEI